MSVDWTNLKKAEFDESYPCNECQTLLMLGSGNIVFCACQAMICQSCKDSDKHKDHQTIDEVYDEFNKQMREAEKCMEEYDDVLRRLADS